MEEAEPSHAPLQEFEEEMARVLGKIRTKYELRKPLEAGEQEELSDKSATPSSSGHTNILPDQEELQDDETLSPIDNSKYIVMDRKRRDWNHKMI